MVAKTEKYTIHGFVGLYPTKKEATESAKTLNKSGHIEKGYSAKPIKEKVNTWIVVVTPKIKRK